MSPKTIVTQRNVYRRCRKLAMTIVWKRIVLIANYLITFEFRSTIFVLLHSQISLFQIRLFLANYPDDNPEVRVEYI